MSHPIWNDPIIEILDRKNVKDCVQAWGVVEYIKATYNAKFLWRTLDGGVYIARGPFPGLYASRLLL